MVHKPEYSLSLFGTPRLWAAGSVVDLNAKQLGLLARLTGSEGRACPRSELARLIWPAVDDRSARHSLSQAIYAIRSRTSPAIFIADAETLSLGAIDSDVEQFLKLCSLGQWEAAAETYHGPFLNGHTLHDCISFEHWLDSARTRYRLLAEQVLEELYGDGAWHPILPLATVLLEDDPDNLRVLAITIATTAATQGVHAAHEKFAALSPGQQSSLGDIQHLVASTCRERPASGAGVAFIGRAAELARLNDRLLHVEGSGSKVTLVQGEPGIGKTSLVARFLKLRTLRGDTCLFAKANDAERNVPFGVVDQWIQGIPDRYLEVFEAAPWWGALRSVFPTSLPSDQALAQDPISHRRILETLRRLFTALRPDGTVVLCIDDAHFCDSASLGFLTFLLNKEPAGSIMVLLAGHASLSARLWAMASEHEVFVIELGSLSAQEVDQWLLRSGMADPTTRAETVPGLLLKTGGNPLLISSLLEGGRDLSVEDLPSTIAEYFHPKIVALTSSARSVITALSIAGEALSLRTLTNILGISLPAAKSATRELIAAGLAVRAEEKVSLRHGLIADVALSLTSDAEKRRIHGRAARMYARAEPTGPAMAAISHDIAGNRRDAYDAAMKAAQACAILNAHEERLFFLKLAMANALDGEDYAAAKIDISDVLLRLRRPREVLNLLQEPLSDGLSMEQRGRMQVQRIRARVALATADDELRSLWLDAKQTSLLLADSKESIASLYTEMGSIAHDLGSDELALEILSETNGLLTALPDSAMKARRSIRPILINGVIGDCAAAMVELGQLKPPDNSDAEYGCMYYAARASLQLSAGDTIRAERDFLDALFIAERHALYDSLFLIHNNLGVCFIEQGRYAEAEDQLVSAQSYGSPETHPTKLRLVADNLSILYYESGRHQQALELVNEGDAGLTGRGIRAQISRFSIMGLVYLCLGRLGQAREVHRELQLKQFDRSPIRTDLSYVHIFHARMLVAGDQPHAALEYLQDVSGRYGRSLALTRYRLELETCRIRRQLGLLNHNIHSLESQLARTGATPLLQQVRRLAQGRV